ncbi:MAG: Gfo/Idh/MocA family oxidoreductase, partial [Clostridia bacterium]|nr:Gfo/Idh/MocA family oxidoreductase [Clostridia bacterium]
MMNRVAHGMVGGAYSAFIGDVHRKAIAFDPRAKLSAGCFSTDLSKNAETGEQCGIDPARVYASYSEMAERESARPDGISFVSVTTPNNTHYDISKCFLKNGINVMCEKPLCFTVAQAEELSALTKAKGLLFGVTYSYSGYTMVRVMREMIRAGKIGEVVAVNAEYAQEWLIDELGESDPGTAKLSGWRSDPKVAGISNCVGDIGTHIEHTVHYLTGLPIKRLLATTNAFGKALEMNANIIVEYANGANGAYWCSQVAAG